MTIAPTAADRGRAVLYWPTPDTEPHEGVLLGIASEDRNGRVTRVNVHFGRGCQPVHVDRLDWGWLAVMEVSS